MLLTHDSWLSKSSSSINSSMPVLVLLCFATKVLSYVYSTPWNGDVCSSVFSILIFRWLICVEVWD